MTSQFLAENTASFDEIARSLKKVTDSMPHNRNRGSRDDSRSGERDRNNSMDSGSQDYTPENTRSSHEHETRDTRNICMPLRHRQDNQTDSRQRHGQKCDSRESRP